MTTYWKLFRKIIAYGCWRNHNFIKKKILAIQHFTGKNSKPFGHSYLHSCVTPEPRYLLPPSKLTVGFRCCSPFLLINSVCVIDCSTTKVSLTREGVIGILNYYLLTSMVYCESPTRASFDLAIAFTANQKLYLPV